MTLALHQKEQKDGRGAQWEREVRLVLSKHADTKMYSISHTHTHTIWSVCTHEPLINIGTYSLRHIQSKPLLHATPRVWCC